MKRLLIMGAGGFGREIRNWCEDVNRVERRWRDVAFLDTNPVALAGFSCPSEIVGDPATFVPSDVDEIVCALGNPVAKLRLCLGLRQRGAVFVNLIHPSAIIGRGCRLGEGCVLCPGAALTSDVTLGNFVVLNLHATVGHDAVIGDGCTLSGHCDVTGHAVLGKGVFLGSHASILPGARVGDFATIGAGSVVLRGVEPWSTVMGVPSKEIIPSDRGKYNAVANMT